MAENETEGLHVNGGFGDHDMEGVGLPGVGPFAGGDPGSPTSFLQGGGPILISDGQRTILATHEQARRMDDCKLYLQRVQDTFSESDWRYQAFIRLLLRCKDGQLSARHVLDKVNVYFRGHNDLIADFGRFLPGHVRVKPRPPIDYVHAVDFIRRLQFLLPENRYLKVIGGLKAWMKPDTSSGSKGKDKDKESEKRIKNLRALIHQLLSDFPALKQEFEFFLPDVSDPQKKDGERLVSELEVPDSGKKAYTEEEQGKMLEAWAYDITAHKSMFATEETAAGEEPAAAAAAAAAAPAVPLGTPKDEDLRIVQTDEEVPALDEPQTFLGEVINSTDGSMSRQFRPPISGGPDVLPEEIARIEVPLKLAPVGATAELPKVKEEKEKVDDASLFAPGAMPVSKRPKLSDPLSKRNGVWVRTVRTPDGDLVHQPLTFYFSISLPHLSGTVQRVWQSGLFELKDVEKEWLKMEFEETRPPFQKGKQPPPTVSRERAYLTLPADLATALDGPGSYPTSMSFKATDGEAEGGASELQPLAPPAAAGGAVGVPTPEDLEGTAEVKWRAGVVSGWKEEKGGLGGQSQSIGAASGMRENWTDKDPVWWEKSIFEIIRRRLADDKHLQFMKCLGLWADGFCTSIQLFKLIDKVFPLDQPKLLRAFKKIVLSREPSRQKKCFWTIPAHNIDSSKKNPDDGPSYVPLPENFPILRPLKVTKPKVKQEESEGKQTTTHRGRGRGGSRSSKDKNKEGEEAEENKWEYPIEDCLNDLCISIPYGSEDHNNFQSTQHNTHQQILLKVEDDRYELDMLIHTCHSCMKSLIKLAQECDEKNLGQDGGQGSRSISELGVDLNELDIPAITKKGLHAAYGEHAAEMWELIRRQPLTTIPVIVERLKWRISELREAHTHLSKTFWQPVQMAHYLPSFEQRSIAAIASQEGGGRNAQGPSQAQIQAMVREMTSCGQYEGGYRRFLSELVSRHISERGHAHCSRDLIDFGFVGRHTLIDPNKGKGKSQSKGPYRPTPLEAAEKKHALDEAAESSQTPRQPNSERPAMMSEGRHKGERTDQSEGARGERTDRRGRGMTGGSSVGAAAAALAEAAKEKEHTATKDVHGFLPEDIEEIGEGDKVEYKVPDLYPEPAPESAKSESGKEKDKEKEKVPTIRKRMEDILIPSTGRKDLPYHERIRQSGQMRQNRGPLAYPRIRAPIGSQLQDPERRKAELKSRLNDPQFSFVVDDQDLWHDVIDLVVWYGLRVGGAGSRRVMAVATFLFADFFLRRRGYCQDECSRESFGHAVARARFRTDCGTEMGQTRSQGLTQHLPSAGAAAGGLQVPGGDGSANALANGAPVVPGLNGEGGGAINRSRPPPVSTQNVHTSAAQLQPGRTEDFGRAGTEDFAILPLDPEGERPPAFLTGHLGGIPTARVAVTNAVELPDDPTLPDLAPCPLPPDNEWVSRDAGVESDEEEMEKRDREVWEKRKKKEGETPNFGAHVRRIACNDLIYASLRYIHWIYDRLKKAKYAITDKHREWEEAAARNGPKRKFSLKCGPIETEMGGLGGKEVTKLLVKYEILDADWDRCPGIKSKEGTKKFDLSFYGSEEVARKAAQRFLVWGAAGDVTKQELLGVYFATTRRKGPISAAGEAGAEGGRKDSRGSVSSSAKASRRKRDRGEESQGLSSEDRRNGWVGDLGEFSDEDDKTLNEEEINKEERKINWENAQSAMKSKIKAPETFHEFLRRTIYGKLADETSSEVQSPGAAGQSGSANSSFGPQEMYELECKQALGKQGPLLFSLPSALGELQKILASMVTDEHTQRLLGLYSAYKEHQGTKAGVLQYEDAARHVLAPQPLIRATHNLSLKRLEFLIEPYDGAISTPGLMDTSKDLSETRQTMRLIAACLVNPVIPPPSTLPVLLEQVLKGPPPQVPTGAAEGAGAAAEGEDESMGVGEEKGQGQPGQTKKRAHPGDPPAAAAAGAKKVKTEAAAAAAGAESKEGGEKETKEKRTLRAVRAQLRQMIVNRPETHAVAVQQEDACADESCRRQHMKRAPAFLKRNLLASLPSVLARRKAERAAALAGSSSSSGGRKAVKKEKSKDKDAKGPRETWFSWKKNGLEMKISKGQQIWYVPGTADFFVQFRKGDRISTPVEELKAACARKPPGVALGVSSEEPEAPLSSPGGGAAAAKKAPRARRGSAQAKAKAQPTAAAAGASAETLEGPLRRAQSLREWVEQRLENVPEEGVVPRSMQRTERMWRFAPETAGETTGSLDVTGPLGGPGVGIGAAAAGGASSSSSSSSAVNGAVSSSSAQGFPTLMRLTKS